ncbi:Fic family protein [Thiohalophilus thiocyanatoxydans]|uniref:Fic family protein n=1 Tax=Thiohalophilus thiocyanatoxydans TaxID=381308 RepID=A0A4R8IQW8_9GAMM|nr:Fic family protein [Thiohalophilus thiocyanatoxydans]TDY02714.1 Fic family protein [Thiohalophilus thiocyanatoxydans]
MPTLLQACSPYVPSDKALRNSPLPDMALAINAASAKLAGRVAEETRRTLIRHMAVINSYYSNLIEGNRTLPHEIRAAQQGEFSADPAKRDLQLESLAHIEAQNWLQDQSPGLDKLFTADFIQAIHRQFYRHIPNTFRELKNEQGEVIEQVIPGDWRSKPVTVGRHHPPPPETLPQFMQQFCETYHPSRYSGDRKVIAVMCAHHRLAWIHPFADGNGRVMRLFTDASLRALGLESEGVWCLSRGLARSSTQYKAALAHTDMPRQGDYDGRGQLSESALLAFCQFMLETALDQIQYMDELLALDAIQARIASYVQARNDNRVSGMGQLKEAASLVLYSAFLQGRLKRAHALELTGMPERSARRLLSQLKQEGLLTEISPRSDLYWAIPAHAEPWYFPQLAPA